MLLLFLPKQLAVNAHIRDLDQLHQDSPLLMAGGSVAGGGSHVGDSSQLGDVLRSGLAENCRIQPPNHLKRPATSYIVELEDGARVSSSWNFKELLRSFELPWGRIGTHDKGEDEVPRRLSQAAAVFDDGTVPQEGLDEQTSASISTPLPSTLPTGDGQWLLPASVPLPVPPGHLVNTTWNSELTHEPTMMV